MQLQKRKVCIPKTPIITCEDGWRLTELDTGVFGGKAL